jgi:glutamyl-tRNA synthetase
MDKKRLSKRHGATSVMEYHRQGYLPEAMVNFLALLGWSPGNDDELMTTAQLVERFTLDGISTGNAVFNTDKLDWFNHQYLNRLSDDELLAMLGPWLQDAGVWDDALMTTRRSWIHEVLALVRPRAKKLGDLVEGLRPFLVAPTSMDPEGAAKHLSLPGLSTHLESLRDALAVVEPFDEPSVEQALRGLAEARGLKAGALIHATRLALTGRTVSPGLFEMLRLIGRQGTIARLTAMVQRLESGVETSDTARLG